MYLLNDRPPLYVVYTFSKEHCVLCGDERNGADHRRNHENCGIFMSNTSVKCLSQPDFSSFPHLLADEINFWTI